MTITNLEWTFVGKTAEDGTRAVAVQFDVDGEQVFLPLKLEDADSHGDVDALVWDYIYALHEIAKTTEEMKELVA